MCRTFAVRRIAKWTGLVLCILSLPAVCLDLTLHHANRKFDDGRHYLGFTGVTLAFFGHEFLVHVLGQSDWQTKLPLWPVFIAFSVPTGILLYRDRRRRIPPGRCSECGYDLTGNVSGICAECGLEIGAASRPVAG